MIDDSDYRERFIQGFRAVRGSAAALPALPSQNGVLGFRARAMEDRPTLLRRYGAVALTEPCGYMLHLWDEAHGLISHTSLIGDFAGPFPFA